MTQVVANFNDRLNEAIEKRDIRPVDLANRTDIPEATISQYRSGYAKPKYERIVRIADALNVSLTWLMGGDVPMEKDQTPPQIKDFSGLGVKNENGFVTYYDKSGAEIVPSPSDLEKMMELYKKYLQALPQIQDAVDSLLGSDKHDS